MAIVPALPEELEEGQRLLRAEIRAPQAEARNVALATEIDADSYFEFRGTNYKVPPLSYKLGVQLQEIQFFLESLVRKEQFTKDLQDLDLDGQIVHLQQLQLAYEQAIALFQKCCYPLAFWKRRRHKRQNPFLTCTSQEIAELLSFFSMCRMRSRVTFQGSLANRPSLSTSMQSTT